MTVTAPETITFDPGALQRLLDGRYGEGRDQIREVLKRPEFASPLAIPTAEHRQQVLDWAKALADEGLTAPGFPEEFGGMGDPGANVVAFETLAFGDLSLLVKFGVSSASGAARFSSSARARTTSAISSRPPRSSCAVASR